MSRVVAAPIVFGLILALSSTLPARADDEPAALRGPIHALCWTAPPPDCANLTGFVWVREDTFPETAAAQSRAAPPARAAVFFWAMTRDLMRHPLDRACTADGKLTKHHGVWPEHGTAAVRARAEFFFRRFQAAGGRVDFVVIDHEDVPGMWGMPPERLDAIAGDPRADALRKELGFDDLSKVLRFRDGPEYLEWNALADRITAEALDRAVFEPARAAYPDVGGSNYNGYALGKAHVVPELNGHLQHAQSRAGTHASPSLYGNIGGLARRSLGDDVATPYGDAPFDVLRWQVNRMRAIALSSGDVPVRPWVSHKTFAESRFRDNDYYQELIYHVALCGADGLLLWNPGRWHDGQNPLEFRTVETDRIVDACLAALNERFADAPRACATPDVMPWDSPVVATGMTIGDGPTARVLWRVTARPGTVGVRVIPGGDVIDMKGGVGAWYESAADARPTFEPM